MVTHVVMLNAKDKSAIPEIAGLIKAMEGNIPELKGIEVGINAISAERNFDVILIARFDSWEDLDKYQVSEYHVEHVLKYLKELTVKSVACDFES